MRGCEIIYGVEAPEKMAIGSFTVAFLTDGLWWNDEADALLGVVPRKLGDASKRQMSGKVSA